MRAVYAHASPGMSRVQFMERVMAMRAALRRIMPHAGEIPVLGIEPRPSRDGGSSRRATTWAWRQWVACPRARSVLLALASFAGDDGECAFRVQRLAKLTCLGEDEAQAALTRLQAMGLVKVGRREDGYRTARLAIGRAAS